MFGHVMINAWLTSFSLAIVEVYLCFKRNWEWHATFRADLFLKLLQHLRMDLLDDIVVIFVPSCSSLFLQDLLNVCGVIELNLSGCKLTVHAIKSSEKFIVVLTIDFGPNSCNDTTNGLSTSWIVRWGAWATYPLGGVFHSFLDPW